MGRWRKHHCSVAVRLRDLGGGISRTVGGYSSDTGTSRTANSIAGVTTALEQSVHRGLRRPEPIFRVAVASAYCSVASSVIVINALRHGAALTQSSVFPNTSTEIRTTFGGMTLAQLGDLLRANGANATVTYASDSNIERSAQLRARTCRRRATSCS
jgi:hypothetical protein